VGHVPAIARLLDRYPGKAASTSPGTGRRGARYP